MDFASIQLCSHGLEYTRKVSSINRRKVGESLRECTTLYLLKQTLEKKT